VLLQSGAKHVYGIECSAIADQAKRIVADNGFSDRVTIIKGKVGAFTPCVLTTCCWLVLPLVPAGWQKGVWCNKSCPCGVFNGRPISLPLSWLAEQQY